MAPARKAAGRQEGLGGSSPGTGGTAPVAEGSRLALGPAGAAAPRPRIALVDGSSLFHRAFFALPLLSDRSGRPTNAVYGFLAMLLRLLEDEKPTHLAVALDLAAPTFRHQEFDAYKAHREGMPEELRSQVPLLRQVLAALGVPVVEQAGYEADDVIGTLASRAAGEGYEVLVVTGDRDAFQLAGDGVRIVYNRRGITDVEVLDGAAVRQRYGVDPERLVDVKALAGDASDNIPGVPTVGEKTALKLIREFGTLEGLLEAVDAGRVGPPRVAAALAAHRDRVLRNKRLATIVRQVPLPVDLEGFRRQPPPDPGHLRSLLEELEMRSLIRRLGLAGPQDGAAPAARAAHGADRGDGGLTGPVDRPAAPGGGEADGAAASPASPSRPWTADFVAFDAARDGAALAAAAAVAVAVAWDPAGEVAGLAVAAPGLGAVRVAAPAGELEAALAAVEEGPDKVGHDLKPWIRHLWRRGRRWRPATFDAAVAAYLLDSGRSAYPLEDLARQYLGRRLPTGGDGSGGRGSARPDQEALAARAAAVLELRAPMEAELEARGLGPLFREVEMPLVEVLAAMEAHGVCVDREALAELDREFRRRLDEAAAAVHAAAGEAFNINSTQQLGRILFEKLGLKPPKKTKTGFSTDAEVLEQLALEHPLPERVLEYRTLQKLQSTYVQALGQLVDPRTGRVHTTFNQTVAATGRLSSEAPNLQNIPVREEIGRRIRRVFVAPPGAVLVSADYSQIDLRVLAHMSGDEGLVQAFRDGVDVHRRTAAEVFGVPLDAVTDSQRTAAKAVNFGLVYGISDFGLARQLRCDQAEARAIMDRYFARYPGVKAYMERVVAEARQRGFVRTLYGRIRYLPDIASRNWARRSFAERMAMNTPIQGTAADLVKRAMVRLHRELEAGGFGAALVLQVHDELILEAPLAERDRVARLARDAMEGAGTLSVPLVAEVKAGPNWYDMEPVRA